MSLTTEDALFERPRVEGAGAQHLDFVIGFDNQSVCAAKSFRCERIEVTQIHRHPNFRPVAFNRESEWISGVVRNGEGMETQRTDLEIQRRRERFAAPHRLDLLAKIAGVERCR